MYIEFKTYSNLVSSNWISIPTKERGICQYSQQLRQANAFLRRGIYHELPSATTGGTKPHLITNYVGHWTFAPMPTESEQQGLQPWQSFYAISTTFALFIEIEEDHPQAMHQMDCKCEVSQVHRGTFNNYVDKNGKGG
jgi:hypothetical protein